MKRGIIFVLLMVVVFGGASRVAAQTPTPPPTPTVSVIETDDGAFVFEPSITYGEAGVIIALLFVAVLTLLSLAMEVVSWFRQ
jgi:hypothetical protein